MSTDSSAAPAPRWSWRFSLGGLLTLITGLGAGLAVSRLSGVRWFDGLLAAFVVWFAIGCWTRAIAACRSGRRVTATADQRTGELLLTLARLFAPVASLLGAGVLIAKQAGMEALVIVDPGLLGALRFLGLGLVVLPVLMSVQPLPRPNARSAKWKAFTDAVGAIGGVCLAIVVVGDMILVPVLVHIAIMGVRGIQRFQLEGDCFSPESYELSSVTTFARQAILAATLWLIAACLLRALAHTAWGTRRSWALGLALGATLAAIASLLAAGMRLADRQVSPILADFVFHEKPVILGWLAVPFLMMGAGYVTCRLLGAEAAMRTDQQAWGGPISIRPWEQWLLVLTAPLIWWIADNWLILGEIGKSAWNDVTGSAPEYSLGAATHLAYFLCEVTTLLMLAYLLVWSQIACRRWKRYAEGASHWSSIAPFKLVAVWLASLGVLATAAPVLAWLCFVLWTWQGDLPGEQWLLVRE